MEFLDWNLYANPLRVWLFALLASVLAVAALTGLNALLIRNFRRFAKRTTTDLDDVLSEVLGATRFWFMVVLALWAGSLVLELPEGRQDLLETAVTLAVLIQFGIWGVTAITAAVESFGKRKLDEDPASVTTMRAVGVVGRLVLWSVILLLALDNLGVDVTALIAGLGIGGIAVALALQNVLGDLFASLSIVLDKPFVVGDFVVVGEMAGSVERVGLKTTRLRSLSGEQLVFSNSDLLASRVRNYKRMYERRIVFSFGVVYSTSYEQLKSIPSLVREIIEAEEKARFDRAHFSGYGDSSLDFEVVYYVLEPDYNVYMDVQQSINLEIFRRFEELGLEFAFPTRTLYVASEGEDDVGSGHPPERANPSVPV